jgi:uncharacterized protein
MTQARAGIPHVCPPAASGPDPFIAKSTTTGTAAMFLVGGGILVHGTPALRDWIQSLAECIAARSGAAGTLQRATSLVLDAVTGIVGGAVVVAVVGGVQRVFRPHPRESEDT